MEEQVHYSRSRNPRTGVVYVYKVLENYWDKEKKQARNKRVLVGKIDEETGQIVPTGPRGRPRKKESASLHAGSALIDNTNEEKYKIQIEKEKDVQQSLAVENQRLKEDLRSLLRYETTLEKQISDLSLTLKEASPLMKKLKKEFQQ